MRNTLLYIILILALVITSCSSTSSLEADDMLYIGMRKIQYSNYVESKHFADTKSELDVALAHAPNKAFFGSPYIRFPFPYDVWIWNACGDKQDFLSKWAKKAFGNPPVLLADANPALHSTVAETVLQNNGYFRGKIDYDIIKSGIGTTKRDSVPRERKAKIAYKVDMGPLFTLDSISYTGFTDEERRIILADSSLLRKGDPFSIATLDEERTRIYKALREYGYYFYRPEYCSYLADTLKVEGKVQLRLHKNDSLPDEVSRKWVLGRTKLSLRREISEQLTDSVSRRFLTINYGGKKPPMRPRVLLPDVRLRPGDLFSQSELDESVMRLTTKGVFSSIEFDFKPRYNPDGSIRCINDTVQQTTRSGKDRSGAGVLDMSIDCTLDKPFDLTLQGNFVQKTSGRGGPGIGFSFGKRNAFRGGEMLSFNLGASVDFPIGEKVTDAAVNYDVLGDVTLDMPRMLLPNFIKPNRHWYSMPTTTLRASFECIFRSGFYRRNIFSAELTYNFRPTETVRHTFSPLKVDYSFIAHHTDKMDSLLETTTYMHLLFRDNFVPKMRYTFDYTSPRKYRNPISLSMSITESGNIANLLMMAAGKGSWNTKEKEMFSVPVSQFLKLEVDWTKTWMIGRKSKVVAHAYGGYIHSYGNASLSPSTEMFYMGGANDLRGFATRSVGPGSLHSDDHYIQYAASLGDIKLMGNIEYRPHLVGSLYGALFIDAGNCWREQGNDDHFGGPNTSLVAARFLDNIAVDAGIGLRYDLDFFVLRIDWGFIVHAPYDTGNSGYFNTPRFSKAQCLNFAIGYPF